MISNSFLQPWLDGKYSLPNLDELNNTIPEIDGGMNWLAINHCFPFHEILNKKILGFNEAWTLNRSYYEKAIKIALDYNGYDLEREDGCDIIHELGPPPDISHPIYIITVKKDAEERIVYVGKSSSDKSRFASGHAAAIKLLDPKYDGYSKYIYLAQIMLYSDKHEYLPLEFIGNKDFSESILDDIESKLIQEYKPELNTQKMKTINIKNDFSVIVEDYATHNKIFDINI